jgi:hypothetical protein
MDPDVISFAAVMGVIILSIGALSGIATVLFRRFREASHPSALPQQRDYDQRLAQLQQSVDAIAVEVERIAEGQRFNTKLLADGERRTAIKEVR